MTSHHIAQLNKIVTDLVAKVAELERKLARLEKTTPPHLAGVERR